MLQSFAPLFALLAIKYFNPAMFWHLTVSFVKLFLDKGMVAVPIAVANKNFGSFLIFMISLMWLFATFIIAIGFTGMQKSGFRSAGEKISIVGLPDTGNGIFLVNYVLPLMVNDVSSIRKLISFGKDYVSVTHFGTGSNCISHLIYSLMKYCNTGISKLYSEPMTHRRILT